MDNQPLTVNEIRAWIEANGKSYTSIAEKIGCTRFDLNHVLVGISKGKRGLPYKIMVALRKKPAPEYWKKKDFAVPKPETIRRFLAANNINFD